MTRCLDCRLVHRDCVCDRIPTVETRMRVVVVRHAAEQKKTSNTARLAARALANAELRDYGGHAASELADLGAAGDALLYPEGGAWSGPPPERLIVLDGSWSQARRMRQRIEPLRGVPVVALVGVTGSRDRLRRARGGASRLSTIEAIAAALAHFEGAAAADPLLALYDEFLRRSRRAGRYPHLERTND